MTAVASYALHTASPSDTRGQSIQTYARVTGVLLALSMLFGFLGEWYIPSRFMSPDAATTAQNITSSLPLYRAGFAAYLVEAICDIGLALLFYVLLKPVNKPLALAAAFFGLVSTALYGVAEIFYYAPTVLLGGASYMKAFSAEQLNALTMVSIRLFSRVGMIFLGLYGIASVLRGYLIFRSGYIPKSLGVLLMLDRAGRIIFANRSAEALFGYESADFTEHSFGDLLAPESRRLALDHLDRLAHSSGAGVLDAGYDAIGRVRQGGLVPLHITMGRIEGGEKLCVVLREVTAWKHTAEELTDAKQAAEKASIAKSEFLAKISHEIRTPLNAIIGFSEVMMDERFGPIGNERYRQYLKDIHASGGHLISLLNDLVDLSKIETGKLDLTFVSVSLNDLTQQCVAIMQQQASREHVIVRTSLSANLPQIVADARSVRQIALNLLSNSIKFTGAGGQVIVSTALTDDQEVVLRVRDTGTGMSEKDLETALEPFRQVATVAHWGSSGTGLGLPIIKALVEANHARFRIASEVGSGTLVEVAFPTTRVLAQ